MMKKTHAEPVIKWLTWGKKGDTVRTRNNARNTPINPTQGGGGAGERGAMQHTGKGGTLDEGEGGRRRQRQTTTTTEPLARRYA